MKLEDALRAVTDTNTVIYSVGYSTAKSEAAHYASRELPTEMVAWGLRIPIRTLAWMHGQPDPDPDATHNKAIQAYDCLTQLVPPLALAKALAILTTDDMKRNIPETVARLTGGEYFKLDAPRSLERYLAEISNHVPNRYVLSFQPQSPHPGFHAIELRLRDHPGLRVTARSGYWADSDATPVSRP